MWDAWRTGAVGLDVVAATAGSVASIEARRAARLSAMLRWTCKHSALYRDAAASRDGSPAPFDAWPVVSKPQLMSRFDDWVTDPRLKLDELLAFVADPEHIGEPFLGRYLVWESSGSRGEPGIFVQDDAALGVYDAIESVRRPVHQPARRLFDPMYAFERIAFVGATNGHFASTASLRRLCRLSPWMRAAMRSHSFLQPVVRLVAALNDQQSTVLATYPTAALLLADEARAGRLRIPLKEVWTGGEGLSDAMRAAISQAFDCPVGQSYGASEFLAMACECRLGGLHLNSDWVLLESVDDRYRPVAPGECGSTTLLTNLANRVQPLIRYDLGDRVKIHAKRCACGSALPLIEVQGRVDDTIALRSPDGGSVNLLPLALTTVLEQSGLFDFQLVQTSEQSLLVQVCAEDAAAQARLSRGQCALKAYLDQQGLAAISVEGRCRAKRQVGRSGKQQRVVGLNPPHAFAEP
jgi:phenylacetate-CoA ligase